MKTAMKRRISAAQGQLECDLIFSGVTFLDVFSCQWRTGDVAVIDGTVVALDTGLKAKRVIDGRGKWLVPGFIDAHVHIESSLLTPFNFEKTVLPKGTTTAVCDPHELANVLGVEGIRYFLNASEKMKLDLRVMLSSCVPATHLETNGGGTITAKDLLPLKDHPQALGLAEMMNVPGVLFGDDSILEKLEMFVDQRIDGHAPLVRGKALSAYASCGICSCHESSELGEAEEKLTKGISVWIREGSVAKDLHALSPLLNVGTSMSAGFCTDDRNPLDIAREGHVDHLVRTSIGLGVDPAVAYRAASYSVANHYGLNRGFNRFGAIAPGFRADLILLDDAKTCAINSVFKTGFDVRELQFSEATKHSMTNTIKATVPAAADLEGPTGTVHVIGVKAGRIISDRSVQKHDAEGVAKISVLERYGHGSKPSNAYVSGFGKNFKGAMASSVGHDSHNLIVVGSSTEDMRAALAALIKSGGGFCVVKNQTVLAELALPFGGLMSDADPKSIEKTLEKLHEASHSIGCELEEPFLQLAFLSLPVIPTLKLTDKGLVDVDQFKIIPVRVS